MDGLQAAWGHEDQYSSSSLLWSNFAAAPAEAQDHDEDDFFLNPIIPQFINSNIHNGNTTSSLIMASPAGLGTDDVDPSYSKSVDDGSMESLDCLLTSASNSNTATTTTTASSAEDADDDSISLIFYSAGNFWNTTTTPPPPPSLPSAVITTADSSENHNKSIHRNNNGRPAGNKRKMSTSIETGGKKKTNHLPQNPRPKTTEGSRVSYTSATSSSDNNNNSNNISFQLQSDSSCPGAGSSSGYEEPDQEAIAQMKEMIYRAAAFRPVNIGAEEVAALTERPKRKNVRISTDPQTAAARQRRERISQRIRVLQRLVPGGNKMDTASMLDEAANYLKFLRSQVKALENVGGHNKISTSSPSPSTTLQSFPLVVPTNLTVSSSSIPTNNYGHQSGETTSSGVVLPIMQTQNNFPSLVLQNPSISDLLYHQYHHHHHQI